jgi:hypothetical protein
VRRLGDAASGADLLVRSRPPGRLLRSTCLITLLVLVALEPSACKRKRTTQALAVEPSEVLVSVVNVNDPAASAQLVYGFYPLEVKSWRWTMQKFTVALKPPPGAAENGARLSFKFSLPEVVFTKLGPVRLSATVNGLALPPESYSKPGDALYSRDVPASALSGDAVSVEFVCDKALPPTGDDARELALIALSIGLETR